jgi:hypothetical protein
MTIDKSTKKITLHKKGTEAISNSSDNKHKIVLVDEIKTYQFDGFTYELVCGK